MSLAISNWKKRSRNKKEGNTLEEMCLAGYPEEVLSYKWGKSVKQIKHQLRQKGLLDKYLEIMGGSDRNKRPGFYSLGLSKKEDNKLQEKVKNSLEGGQSVDVTGKLLGIPPSTLKGYLKRNAIVIS